MRHAFYFLILAVFLMPCSSSCEELAATSIDETMTQALDQKATKFEGGGQACIWVHLTTGLDVAERCQIELEVGQAHNAAMLQAALEKYILDNAPDRVEVHDWMR